MKASVCYITCGMHGLQERTLQSLLQNTPIEHEIVIFQNGCAIETPILRDNVQMLHSEDRIGVAPARVTCEQVCTGDAIIWMDDDIEAAAGYVNAFLEPYSDSQVGITGYDAVIIQNDLGNQWFVDPEETDGELDYFDSPYSVRISMLQELGGYDRNTGKYVCDNTDVCLRAQADNWKLHYIHNPGLKHRRNSTMEGLHRQGLLTFAARHNETLKSTQYMLDKHGAEWRQRYGMQRKPFAVDSRLQFPAITGRLGGPEDRKDPYWISYDEAFQY